MRCTSSSLPSLALACLLGPSTLPAAEDARTIELKVPRGKSLSFVVEREIVTTFGTGERKSTSRVEYSIAAAGVNDRGDRVFTVKYVTLKSTREGGQRAFEFDSTKDRSGGEFSDLLRRSIAKPITVTVAGGKIRDVSGFPSSPADDGDRGARFRRFMVERIAGRRAVDRDVNLILAMAVHGQSLEKDKAYKLAPAPRPEGRRRGFGFGRGDATVVYRFDGLADGGARFSLTAEYPPLSAEARERGARRKGSASGQALVSLKDGAVLRLELTSETEFSGEFQGREFRSTSREVTTVERSTAKAKAKAKKKKKVTDL